MSHYYAKFKENSCVGTDASTPFHVLRSHDVEGTGQHFMLMAVIYDGVPSTEV